MGAANPLHSTFHILHSLAAPKSTEGSVKDLLREQAYSQPVYFLQGDEPYFIDALTDRMMDTVPDQERSFNLSVLFGKDVDMRAVLTSARQFPFLGDKRMVVVKEAQMMDSLTRGDDGPGQLEKYLENPQTSTTLIFCFKGKALDGRKGLAQKLKARGYLFSSNKLPDWDSRGLEAIVEDLCKQAKVKVDRGAIARLAQYVGNDISRMANEVAKLRVAVPDGASVTDETVLTYIGVSKDYSIFEFQKALAQRDFPTALKLAGYYARNEKEHHILKELAFLTTFFTRLLVAQTHKAKAGRVPDPGTLGFKMTPDMDRALTSYNLAQLASVIHLLAEADRLAKGAGAIPMENEQIWPWLVFRIFEAR